MKKCITLLLAAVLLLSLALPVAAEEEIPYEVYLEEPGSYTAIGSQQFIWTAPENGKYSFIIDSPSNWSFWGYADGIGMIWGEPGSEEGICNTFSSYLEAGATVTMSIRYVPDGDETGTVDFHFTFEPDGTGTGGYVMESTHHISGDGSYEAPYVYNTVEDFLADWTNRKIPEGNQLYITAPLGGKTLRVDSRYTDPDMAAYGTYSDWKVQIHYLSDDGYTLECDVTLFTPWEDNPRTSFTFDEAGFETALQDCPSWTTKYTLIDEPWQDGDLVTICYFGPASSPYFMAVDMVLEGYEAPEAELLLGDVNGDEDIDILDANLVVAWYNEIRELDDDQLTAADVNGDGEVDIMDANMIVAYYNEIIDNFPAAK